MHYIFLGLSLGSTISALIQIAKDNFQAAISYGLIALASGILYAGIEVASAIKEKK